MKVLTVIVCVFGETFLQRCCDSLSYNDQLDEELEVLVGKPDDIANLIMLARGRYCMLVDADNWLDIDELPQVVVELKQVDLDLIVTDYWINDVRRSESYPVRMTQIESGQEVPLALSKEVRRLCPDALIVKTDRLQHAWKTLHPQITYRLGADIVATIVLEIESVWKSRASVLHRCTGQKTDRTSVFVLFPWRAKHAQEAWQLMHLLRIRKWHENQKALLDELAIAMINEHYEIYYQNTGLTGRERRELPQFDRALKQMAPSLYAKIPAARHSRQQLNRLYQWCRKKVLK